MDNQSVDEWENSGLSPDAQFFTFSYNVSFILKTQKEKKRMNCRYDGDGARWNMLKSWRRVPPIDTLLR
jgi:hypothetical protein